MATPRKMVSMQTKHLTKAEIEYKEKAESRLRLGRDSLQAPEWLSADAKAEFIRVVEEAAKVNLLDNLDLGVLAIYADNYSRYVQASIDVQMNGYCMTTSSGYQQVSPAMTVLNQSAKNIMSCSSKLGLATTDRLKLIVPMQKEKEPENKFMKFIENGA